MHIKVMDDGEEFQSAAAREDRNQAEALRQVRHIYPEAMTLDELVCELTVASEEFSERDRVERAVSDLIGRTPFIGPPRMRARGWSVSSIAPARRLA